MRKQGLNKWFSFFKKKFKPLNLKQMYLIVDKYGIKL